MPLDVPDHRYQLLARKWLDGSITEKERLEFAQWYNHGQDEPVEIPENFASTEEEHRTRLFSNIESRMQESPRTYPMPVFRSLMAAAVVLIMLAAGGYFLLQLNRSEHTDGPVAVADIAPGGDKATLTLGDGSVLELQSLSDGSIAGEKGLKVRKQQGELIYEKTAAPDRKISYHTITTPRGGQYRVVLPDGSKVWLNASSSLQYPTHFDGDEARKVKLSGEGYFEVAKSRFADNKNRPFLINVSDREQVEVLGTHFNIMAYSDERVIRTTLLEGSVRVSKNGTSHRRLLLPGQQAVSSEKQGFEVKSAVDITESVSWKNGQISFKDADIRSIMRQVARWYDVDVRYEGELPTRLFNGGISRSSNLSSVLKVLELNDIHFKVEKKTITVMP